jgi:hypothetical protein
MKEVWPSMLLAFPFTVYVGARVLGAVSASQGAFWGMFVTMFVLSVLSVVPNERLFEWTSVVELIATIGIVGGLYFDINFGSQLLAGGLLASPALLVGFSVRPGPLGGKLFAFALALTDGLGLLATVVALTNAGVAVSGGEFTREFIYLNVTQGQGLYALLASTTGSLPLMNFFDPDYVVLAAIAAAGLLLASLRPQTAWGDLLPAAGTGSTDTSREETPMDVGPELIAALSDRSLPEPAAGVPPGIPALLGGCVAAAFVVVAAYASPKATLLLIVIGILVTLGFTIAVMRRAARSRR